jgi:hypothetical protein
MTTREQLRPPAPAAPAPRRRFELSGTQVIASALAAITATVAGSFLGVSGTVIGAALASVLTVTGNAVYGHSLRSTRDRVREVVPVGRFAARPDLTDTAPDRRRDSTRVIAAPPELPPVLPDGRAPRPGPSGPWRRIAIGSIAVFVAVLAVVTGIEAVAGRPLSDLVRGDAGSGTSVFGDQPRTSGGGAGTGTGSAPTVTRTVTPSVVVTTPTVTQTAPAAVTRTATPTVTTTPTADPTRPAPTTSAPASTATPTPTTTVSP